VSASEETESSAAVTMSCRPVDTDEPRLPVRRHKRRRADAVQTSDVEPRRAFTDRHTHSDSEPHCYESVRDSSTTAHHFRSLSASAAHLSHQDTAMTSPHWINDVTVTSSAAVVTESSCEPAMTATCDQQAESLERTTSSLYCRPRKQQDMTSATMTRRRSSDDVRLSRSSAHTSTRPTRCRQLPVTDYDDTVTSSDYYEPVDYSHSDVTSMSSCQSHAQQSRSKQQVHNLVYMGLQGSLLTKLGLLTIFWLLIRPPDDSRRPYILLLCLFRFGSLLCRRRFELQQFY